MTKGEIKREFLFDKYAGNLNFLNENGKIEMDLALTAGDYICPICFNKFTKADLQQNSKNPLTLEDAPPKSLGGSQIVLTCESCNNNLGKDIDWHLTERLKELDFKHKITGAEQKGKFTLNGLTINGKIEVHENKVTKAVLSKKNNNPILLEKYINLIKSKKNSKPFWKRQSTRVDPKKLQIALLKNAYLLLFEKFGYSFLFDKEYDRIREQLLKPEMDVYPLNCWFHGPFPKERIGVPFITEKNMESIFTLFELKTKLSNRLFGVVLPLSSSKIEKTITELNSRFLKEKQFAVEMMSFTDDYLTNLKSLNLLLDWMKKYK